MPEQDIDEDIRAEAPMDFVYNDGTSAHRGVWHLTDDLKVTVTPATTETKEYEVIDWAKGVPKSQAVKGQRYYEALSYRGPNECARCGRPESSHPVLAMRSYEHVFEEPQVYPIIAVTTLVIETPRFETGIGRAACGSGKFGGENLVRPNLYRIGTAKKYAGKTLRIEGGRVTPGQFTSSFVLPNPFCGHCLKLIERQRGSATADTALGIEVLD